MKRSYKQVLSIIAAITLLSGGIPQNSTLPLRPALTVSAADISLDDFKYELTSDEEGVIITQYTGSDTAVVVPDEINDMPVTEIGSWAFFDKNDIISINLPDTVTSIGNNAFNLLINLQKINMPAELTTIGSGAFCQTGLTEVKLPDKVTSIGSYAFASCASLETTSV